MTSPEANGLGAKGAGTPGVEAKGPGMAPDPAGNIGGKAPEAMGPGAMGAMTGIGPDGFWGKFGSP